ncbi:MAG: HepT-like ribonuclease domain-containing protein [Gammaproteobacteria bacterium]
MTACACGTGSTPRARPSPGCIADFGRGKVRTDLDDDRLLVLGLLKCIEIVGEAAAHIGPDTKSCYPEIPWADIVGMRNRLVHAYFDIDPDRVWDTLEQDLPPLVDTLEKILAGSESS